MNIMMTVEELKELFEYSKALKCDIIRVKDKTLYGTDNNFIHLKTIRLNSNIIWPDMIFYLKDLINFMKQIDDISKIDTLINIFEFIITHNEFINLFDNLIVSVNMYLVNPISFSDEDLKSNEDFNTINAMKSGDGMGLLKLSNKYILALFSGLLPVNKNDKIAIYIRDIDNYRYFANFTITKKKFSIDIYFMYLFLN